MLFRSYYVGDLLEDFAPLKEVMVLWDELGYLHYCRPEGDLLEGWADPESVDNNAWAAV